MTFGRLTGIAIVLLALTVIPNLPQAQAQETAAPRMITDEEMARALSAFEPVKTAAPRITNEEAKTAVDAAEAEARRNGWAQIFIITDAEGIPIYLRRMDGVPTYRYITGMNKVNTVHTLGMDTWDYARAVEAGRIEALEGALPYGGGLILRRGGQVVGAFIASGRPGPDNIQVVRTGMAAIGL